jgi:hypothetical protein
MSELKIAIQSTKITPITDHVARVEMTLVGKSELATGDTDSDEFTETVTFSVIVSHAEDRRLLPLAAIHVKALQRARPAIVDESMSLQELLSLLRQ